MKLTKENIYINLQGKSEEELNLITEITGVENLKNYYYLQFYTPLNQWIRYHVWVYNIKNKTEVTIQQLKEILQPMESKEFDLKGYSVEVDNEVQAQHLQEFAFKQGFEWYDGKNVCLLNKKFFSFNAFNDNLIHCCNKHFKDEYVTKEIHFNDIFKTELTLTEQLEKAEAEVKRLKEAIEDSKIKINDWVYNKEEDIIYQKSYNIYNQYEKKITNPQLIELLEQEIK